MKVLTFTIFVAFTFMTPQVKAQQIQGGCTTVSFTTFPSFPTVWKDELNAYLICDETDPCSTLSSSDTCCRISYYRPVAIWPQLIFQKKNSQGNFQTVSTHNGNSGFVWNNLDKGVYRVKIRLPIVNLVYCCANEPKPTKLWWWSGQLAGLMGHLATDEIVTNEVLVGPADQSDNVAFFVDPNNNNAFNIGDQVDFDATQSTHYDQWVINILESGPTHNRWHGTGWQLGSQANVFDISSFWIDTRGSFEAWHNYNVQFVVENNNCVNGIEWPADSWNVKNYSFFICAAGSGCKLSKADYKIRVSPNPASDLIRVLDIEDIWQEGFTLMLYDMTGRLWIEQELNLPEVDISQIPSGMYVLQIQRLGEQIHTNRLIIQK